MKFMTALAAMAMSALVLTPTLSPGDEGTRSQLIADSAGDATGRRA